MKNQMFLAVVSTFNGKTAKPNKHGLDPLILEVIAGSCPVKRVVDGSVAKNAKLEAGTTCMIKWSEDEMDEEYGSQYIFTKLMEVSCPMDILNISEKLGNADLF